MSRAVLSLGSNMGDREALLSAALRRLDALPDTRLTKVSSRYVTAPWGGVEQEDFLNLCAEVETALPPRVLLSCLQRIEQEAHRVRVLRWGPRTLDIDIVFYEGVLCDTPTLTLPHPRFSERAFVLVPLAELYPDKKVFGLNFAPFLEAVKEQKIEKLTKEG